MITQLLTVPLITNLVEGMLGEAPPYVPPPPPPPPQVPQGSISFGSPTITDTTISQPFTYSASDYTGFYFKLNSGSQIVEDSPIALEGLTPETAYNISVAAYNAVGTGTWYSTTVTTAEAEPPPPPPPSVPVGTTTITTATPTQTTVDVTFTYTNGVNGTDYTGFQYQLNGGTWVTAPAAPGTFQIIDLTHSTGYTILMRAYNGVGVGAVSNEVAFTTLVPPPPPPETRWVYRLDGVDDRIMLPVSFIRNGFTGTYKWVFEIETMVHSNFKCLFMQTINSSSFSNIDVSIQFGLLTARYTLRCMGQGVNDATFSNSVVWGPGVWEFTWNPTTKLFTCTKNGVTAFSYTLTSATRTTIKQAGPPVVGAAVGSSAGVYTDFANITYKRLAMYEDDVLVYENLFSAKDASSQPALLGAAATLFNQNTANWSEIPL